MLLAPKPNGGVCFCIDYRALNKVTVKDVHPLPIMDDLIGHLEEAKYYATTDLEAGFWQIPVAECDRPKTAIVTPDGLYQFKRLPFLLQASPPNFQRLMNFVLKEQLWTECLCYPDDILVYGESFEEHNFRVDHVPASLSAAGLTLNPDKCSFGMRDIKFLGHRIDAEGIRSDTKKVEAMSRFPRPDSTTKVVAFLEMASFYRKFTQGFSNIARPLHDLLKKNADVVGIEKRVKKRPFRL